MKYARASLDDQEIGITSTNYFNRLNSWLTNEKILQYLPLGLVFLSGFGFSIQTLFVKLLEEGGFSGSFFIVFCRGWIQLFISSFAIKLQQNPEEDVKLCGNTPFIAFMLFLRSVIGFGGIAFSFMSVERIPMGDATVLVTLSPFFSAVLARIILGEPYYMLEFLATILSLIGAVLVARPQFIFHDADRFIPLDTTGVILALLGAVTSGGAYITVRILGTSAKMPWSHVCFAQALGQIILAGPCILLSGQGFHLNLTYLQFCIVFIGGFIGAWSQIAMTIGMQREKSASATAMRMSDVIFGYCWQVAFTNDDIIILSIIGTCLIAGSVLIVVLSKQLNSQQIVNSTFPTSHSSSSSLSDASPKVISLSPLFLKGNTDTLLGQESAHEAKKDLNGGYITLKTDEQQSSS